MTKQEKVAAGFLSVLLVLCFFIVGLGGYVRLSGSGLSIPEWPMFTTDVTTLPDGTMKKERALIPPSDEAGWEHLRETFVRVIPGFEEGIGLSEFKRMFWIEWSHRATASIIGFVYLALLAYVIAKTDLRRRFAWVLTGGLVLLAAQAVVGALVVFAHLEEVKVALHLIIAFLFSCLLLWTLMRIVHPPLPLDKRPGRNPVLTVSTIVFLLALTQIFSGGLMAASMAGYMLQTWPLMGDKLVPNNMWDDAFGFYQNMTENKVVIQFTHRWFAFVVAAGVLFLVARAMTVKVSRVARWSLRGLFAVVILQIGLGVLTLLTGVHVHLAITHQIVGLVLLLNIFLVVYETASHEVLAEDALAELEEGEKKTFPAHGTLNNA